MKHCILFIIACVAANCLLAQTADPWIRFTDEEKELSGYKDLKGTIKIPPKFEALTQADTFYNIIAVNEEVDGKYISYYLLKDGRKVGLDSVCYFDFMPDCESEGMILFRDRTKDRVGFFDSAGCVIIPAVYNYASSFHNGVAIAHKNAIRKCWGSDSTDCEHWSWDGGETILINERNEVLVDDWNVDGTALNWRSMQVNGPLVDTNIYITVAGVNGNRYSFLNYEKEFRVWFEKTFVPAANSGVTERLEVLSFDEITYWSEKEAKWQSNPKADFFKRWRTPLFDTRFKSISAASPRISIGQEGLNNFIFSAPPYQSFYNACGEHLKEVYPVFDVMLTCSGKGSLPRQEHFEFIRTSAGYRLLSVSVKDASLF